MTIKEAALRFLKLIREQSPPGFYIRLKVDQDGDVVGFHLEVNVYASDVRSKCDDDYLFTSDGYVKFEWIENGHEDFTGAQWVEATFANTIRAAMKYGAIHDLALGGRVPTLENPFPAWQTNEEFKERYREIWPLLETLKERVRSGRQTNNERRRA